MTAPDPSVFAGRSVLIVEDEMVIAMMLEDVVERLGCRVTATAGSPSRALAAIEAEQPDAAVLDVNLDGRDSYDVAAVLEARGVPFVFSTGYGGQGLKAAFADRPVMQKPFTEAEVARALAALWAG